MKKILLLMALSLVSFKSMAQVLVFDATSAANIVNLATTASQQVDALSSMFDLMEKTKEIRSVISQGIISLGNIKSIINSSTNALNSTKYLIDFLSKNHNILTVKQALRYSGICISTTESIIKNIDRATQLIQDNFIEGDPLEKAEALNKIDKEMELKNEEVAKIESQIKYQAKIQNLERSFLRSQGIIR